MLSEVLPIPGQMASVKSSTVNKMVTIKSKPYEINTTWQCKNKKCSY
jgi:hypothetical protein